MCHIYGAFTVLIVICQCLCKDSVNPKKITLTTSHKDDITNRNIPDTSSNTTKIGIIVSELSLDTNETSTANLTAGMMNPGFANRFGLDTGAVKRTFYVVATLTGIVLLYFSIKGIRTMRRRRHKPRRYGLLADSKEMKRFHDEAEDESEEGDEDATLFDVRKHRTANKRGP